MYEAVIAFIEKLDVPNKLPVNEVDVTDPRTVKLDPDTSNDPVITALPENGKALDTEPGGP